MCIDSFTRENGFLSNFYPSQIVINGLVYSTVEHAYQAAKCKHSVDADRIRKSTSPGVAKKLGRRVVIRDDWEKVKTDVMFELVHEKFKQNKELRDLLIATGTAELKEGNWWGDTFWGVDDKTGVGENHLGRILMMVRAGLIA